MNSCLMVIDVQEDYTGTKATFPFPYKDSDSVISRINGLIDYARERNFEILFIQHEFPNSLVGRIKGLSKVIRGSDGACLDSRINAGVGQRFTKDQGSALTNPETLAYLKKQQVRRLYIVGLDAIGCVKCTAYDGLEQGFDIVAIEDCILTLNMKGLGKILKKYKEKGVKCVVSTALLNGDLDK